MPFIGFDIATCPSEENLQKLWSNTPFHFTSFYTGPHALDAESYKGKAAMIKAIGYGLLLIFVGQQTGGSLSYDQGMDDANEAAILIQEETDRANNPSIDPHATIFLDVEQGGLLPNTHLEYIAGFCWGLMTATSYYPGIYCSYRTADQIKEHLDAIMVEREDQLEPLSRYTQFWVWNLSQSSSPGCTISVGLDLKDCGVPYASVWQYAQSPTGKECAVEYNGVRMYVDLNVASCSNPSGA